MHDMTWLKHRPIAHRGLHDQEAGIAENTMSAFDRAIEGAFAIECDLHLAADGVPVIFHDHDLLRLCNLPGKLRDKSAGELALLSLGNTKDTIPTLKSLLKKVNGRVPLVLELKGVKGDDDGFVGAVLEDLEGYQGHVGIMSFDHWLLADCKALECPLPLGLTADGTDPQALAKHQEALALELDFISYNLHHLPNPLIEAERKKGMTIITWTARNLAERDHSLAFADQITFEGFNPDI